MGEPIATESMRIAWLKKTYWHKKANFMSVLITVYWTDQIAILRKRKRAREQSALLASEGGFPLIVKTFSHSIRIIE